MLKQLIEYINGVKREPKIEIGEKQFILSGYDEISKSEPHVDTLGLQTLTGLVDYIKNGIDKKSIKEGSFIHVKNYNEVSFRSEIFGHNKQRESFINSHFNDNSISEEWCDAERFIIKVNSIFQHTHDYEYLMSLVSGLSSEASKEISDNGITQTAVVKTGITTVGTIEVKNPITLQPFRTFPEISQPEISYVFRLQEGRNGSPNCALFECDGGMWKLNTVHAIRDYLKDALVDTGVNIIA